MKKQMTLYALFLALAMSGCGERGPAGAPGVQGEPGINGTTGGQGPTGQSGTTGGNPDDPFRIANAHGAAHAKEAMRGTNNSANLCTTITSAAMNVVSGKVEVDFTVKSSGADGIPCTSDDVGYTGLAKGNPSFYLAELRDGASYGDSTYWVSYINKSVSSTGYAGQNPATYKINQASTESSSLGTWTEVGGGAYKYVTAAAINTTINISVNNSDTSILPQGGVYSFDSQVKAVRVGITLNADVTVGANNPTYDFDPATNMPVADPREVVVIANCNECHRTLGAHHSGSRNDTKLCVICHNPTSGDPESGNTIDLKVMVHKIHSARYLPSVNFDFAGEFNGLYKTNPEGAVKGTPYRIWGVRNSLHDFSEISFPANPANCLMCHKNATQGDNYRTVPTKEACGSCHDGIDWATGTGTRMWFPDSKITMGSTGVEVPRTDLTGFAAEIAKGHLTGIKTNAVCATCHTPSGSQASPDASPAGISDTHGDFTNGWSKVKTDYNITVTTDKPSYVAGDKPIVTIVINNVAAGAPIDHTKISDASTTADPNADFGTGTNTGNLYGLYNADGTPKGVSVNGTLNLYVSGPRAQMKPALTTAALNKKFFSSKGEIYGNAANDLRTRTGTNTVLQDDYQFVNGVATPTKLTGVISRADTTKIQYQLSAIPSNKAPGTYVAMVHATKKSVAGAVPKAVSIGVARFNVRQTTEEKRVAYGCPDCHSTNMWHDNAVNGVKGNHPAKFDPDLCGVCHDYEAQQLAYSKGGTSYTVSLDSSGNEVFTPLNLLKGSGQAWKTGGNNMGFSASPSARRMHGVHMGSVKRADGTLMMKYPYEVYNGHNVTVTFPQDIRNCEKCHDSTTTGTWKTKPSRVTCLACHDSDKAYLHATGQTADPTPFVEYSSYPSTEPIYGPYNGDELEACQGCHRSSQ